MSQMFVKQNQRGINLELDLPPPPPPPGVEPQSSPRRLNPNEPITLREGEYLFVTGYTAGSAGNNTTREYTLQVGKIGPDGEFQGTQDTYPKEIVLKNGTVYITTKTTSTNQAIHSERYVPLTNIQGNFTSAREYYLNPQSSQDIANIYNRSLNKR